MTKARSRRPTLRLVHVFKQPLRVLIASTALQLIASLAVAQNLNTNCDLSADAISVGNGFWLSAPQTCIDVNGKTRCWYTYTNPKVVASDNTNNTSNQQQIPLVIDIHGRTGCASWMPWYSGWARLASEATNAQEHFILAMPQGNTDASISDSTCWNAGYCCCFRNNDAPVNQVEDMLFLTKMMDTLLSDFASIIDVNRVYLAGHSNGCMMAQRFIAERSDLIAAVGCHAGVVTIGDMPNFFGNPNWLLPSKVNATGYVPTPVITVHGTADDVVPYYGGQYLRHPGAEESISWWAEANECDLTAKSVTVDSSGKYATHAYSGCAGGASVQLLEMYDVGHTPYEGVDTDMDTTSLVKEFMFQFERQELQLPSSSPSNEPTSQVSAFPSSSPVDVPYSSQSNQFANSSSVPYMNEQKAPSASPELQSADESLLQGSNGNIITTKIIFVTVFVLTYAFSFI
uniref:Feruloyl esterase n=1 Tax=Leptocylindrus danicus TaxID=163516 RepID=A0A7S2LF49_9STRA